VAAGLGAHVIRATESGEAGTLGLAAASIGEGTPYRDESLDSDFQATLRAREVFYRSYAADEDIPVWVFLAYFDRPREGSQVHSPRHCYPGAGWSIEEEIQTEAPWRDGNMHALIVSDGSVKRLVCYWYQTPDGIVSDVLRLKLVLMKQAVLRRPQDVVYGNVSTRIDTDRAAAYQHIAPYVRDAEQQIEQLYREQNGPGARVH
jgi:EpsI family protein